VDQIVRRAGLSKGTFYWTFDSKEDLFVALLEDRLDSSVRRLLEGIRNAPVAERTGNTVSRGLADLFSADPQIVRLLHEYWSAAIRDRSHAARYRRRHGALREALALALAARHEQTGVPLALPAEDLAEALIALAIGLGMAALLDRHSVRRELFGEIASLLYDGLAHRAERGPISGRRT
jgi:AcrR family transcriptional regulator